MKALIVDDDSIVRDCCTLVLRAEGHETVAVDSALAALDELDGERSDDERFDVVLLDVKMPVRDGYSLMADITRRWPDLPLIVMSGFSTDETISESYRLGAATFLAKPFEPDELLEAIGKAKRGEGRGHEKT